MTLAALRELAERLPDGAALMLPKAVLLEALATAAPSAVGMAPADFTVAELAARMHRAPSTVRGWCEAGRFEGAYKLNRRDWRIPRAAVEAFLSRQQAGHARSRPDLGAWRQHRRQRG